MDNIVLVIVLLTLVPPRGVTDLYLSWGINIEHARTAYHKTYGTQYQQPYRRCNSQTPYFNWNIAQACAMSVSDVSRSLQSWVSTTHRSYSQLKFFDFFNKKLKNASCEYNHLNGWNCDEILPSVEFVTVGFLRICRHSCCDWFPGIRGWCPGVLMRLRLKGALRLMSVEKPVNWNWGQCFWGAPQQWWPGSSSGCPSQYRY